MKQIQRAFTVIELLATVAILVLLIAMLLPSLSRARATSRMVVCQNNLRQLGSGFVSYAVGNMGRLPAQRCDDFADWLGLYNKFAPGYRPDDRFRPAIGHQPEDGTFWRYMGRNKWVYICPDDYRDKLPANSLYYSYPANLLLSGAKTEMLAGAHYPLNDFCNPNHRASANRRMRAFEGVPMLIEEEKDYWLESSTDSGWSNDDRITERHLRTGGKGYGSIAFHDTHVGRIQLPAGMAGTAANKYFAANDMCLRIRGGKWVCGWQWDDWYYAFGTRRPVSSMYGYLDAARPAESGGTWGAYPYWSWTPVNH